MKRSLLLLLSIVALSLGACAESSSPDQAFNLEFPGDGGTDTNEPMDDDNQDSEQRGCAAE